MVYNRFSIVVAIQVLLISLTGFIIAWAFSKDYLIVARFTIILLWILQILYLIHYVNKTNRTLRIFLEAIRHSDSIREKTGKGKSFTQLNVTYNEIIDVIREAKIEKESEHFYLQHILSHVGTGIITYNDTNRIELINQAAKEILSIKSIRFLTDLDMVHKGLSQNILKMKSNNQELFKLNINNELVRIAVLSGEFIIREKRINLVAFQNINSELAEEELDAWQKLIRVLTHEIMNSVTPMKSLTNTVIRMFEKNGEKKDISELDNNTISDALLGLHTIESRNSGLLNFIDQYRSITKVPKPTIAGIKPADLFNNIITLLKKDLDKNCIKINLDISPKNLILHVDNKLIEQVLINMVNNSISALTGVDDKKISLVAKKIDGNNYIEISDNGTGMPEEVMENIFIPFFTTKENGSGIGLSLSRQIMQVHKGGISVRSVPGKETVFTLKF
ncbi:PAS domain-containing sensor histidine kinase [Bacteroidota bacterium]